MTGGTRPQWLPFRGRLAVGALALLATLAAATGVASAAGERPERGPFFGYNEHWPEHPDKLSLTAQGGADVGRAVISWKLVEPRPGERSWAHVDKLYWQMISTGMRPIWVLADAPCWSFASKVKRCKKRDPLGRIPARDHDPDWARFVADLAERYPWVAAIETWNEPNLKDFWRPRPDPYRAAELAAWANFVVDRVNPKIPVVLGGMAPLVENEPKKGKIAYTQFIRRAYAAFGKGHWDAVAIHPFPRFKNRDGYLGDIRDHLKAVRGVLAQSGAAGTPIWVTEIGLSTSGPFPYSKHKQRRGLTRIYWALASMPDVSAIIVHRLVDSPKRIRTAESGWGVMRRNGKPKPAFCALATARGGNCPSR